MKKIAVAFTGQSNSGKTTLIVKLSEKLQEMGNKVCIIKHEPGDKAKFDKEGKDSHKFSSTGADVAVVSPTRTTMYKQTPSEIDSVVSMFGEFDYILVEGLKTLPLPRICVQRESLNPDYFNVSDAIATDESINKEDIPKESKHLDLNNLDEIISWIENNGKKY